MTNHLKPGILPPTGYVAWDEWAEAQVKAGLKQTQCPACHLWLFPQEKAGHQCGKEPHASHKKMS